MTAPDKPGLSNEEGKPTPGQIGAIDGDKLYAAMGRTDDSEIYWAEQLKSGRFSVSGQGSLEQPWSGPKRINGLSETPGQGQEERDYTPEEAQKAVKERFGEKAWAVYDYREGQLVWVILKTWGLFGQDDELGTGLTFRAAFASADKAEAEREKK